MRPTLFLDIETAALPNAADYLDPIEPSARLKDPEKIKAHEAERLIKAPLDPHLGRIVCVGYALDADPCASVVPCPDEAIEQQAIALAANLIVRVGSGRPVIVGYNCRSFDLPYLIRRAQLLGVPFPRVDLRKYANPDVTDLLDLVTFHEDIHKVMPCRLETVCRRFGIQVEDHVRGADIAALVEAEDWAAVARHCEADIERTQRLYARLVTDQAFDRR